MFYEHAADGVAVGEKAPPFSLRDRHGLYHSLSEITSRYVVVFFYPRDGSPFCAREILEFQKHAETFREHDVALVGISTGNERSKSAFCDRHGIDILLLSDPDLSIASCYGACSENTSRGKAVLGALRRTYLIGPDRRVISVQSHMEPELHVAGILRELESVEAPSSGRAQASAIPTTASRA